MAAEADGLSVVLLFSIGGSLDSQLCLFMSPVITRKSAVSVVLEFYSVVAVPRCGFVVFCVRLSVSQKEQ
jgi:hypothetical protein